ncbi:hypothetical protein C8Q80DRAFT_1230311 [Daedaleopsis nitida]|nr:hypothetical protein C8Q80DRAFT_1230311 [Daedaleopsis nitida]
MADPIHYRLSNSSDDSPLQEDPSDSEHDTTPLDEDVEEAIQTLDPRNSQLSLHSGAGHSLDDRRRHRRSLTHRDFFKSLVEEGGEAKQLRKLLRAALERLDGETRRAQEAERRALELAQRFKIVNEARVSAQQEIERVHSELRMYKVQLDNAQREILRGSDLLKDLESQRDTAEASAARARSTARRLKEEQLMTRAREEGRKEGYTEGLKRGYQQARGTGLEGQIFEVPPAGLPPLSSIVGDPSRAEDHTEPLDGFSMMNLSTPPHASIPLTFSLGGHAPPDDDDGQYGAGAQGSRFREIMATPSTLRSAPLDSGSQAGGSWLASNPSEEPIRYIRPTLAHNPPAASQHPNYSKPPDGYIPPMGADHIIAMPPPHELYDQPSTSSIHLGSATAADELVAAPPVNSRDYAYTHRPRGSPRSFADSLPSTTISQFELVSSPKTATRGLRERSSGLSAIPEVSSSMEFSPGTDSRVRSAILPDPFTYPGPDDRISVDDPGNAIPRPRSRDVSQRMADELRYSDPELVEQWRRSTASQSHPSSSRERLHTPHRPTHVTTPSPLSGPSITGTPSPANPSPSHRRSRSVQSPPSDGRPYLGAGSSSGAHRRTASSTPISIRIEPPSGPGSNISPASYQDDMLSPEISSRPSLPPVSSGTPTPDRPHSRGQPGSNHPYGYGVPNPPAQSPYYSMPQPPSSPRHTPDPTRGYSPYSYVPTPSPLGEQGRPRSRTGSADFGRGVGSDYSSRPRTPTGRPSSAMAGDYPPQGRPPTRSSTPGHSSAPYAMPPQSVPSVLRSPSRASSRQSLQPEPMRPSSRASADHHRSLSMHAGSTPAMIQRPLSGSQIRRVPSAGSVNSETSRKSGMYQPFDSTTYVDPATLASTEDLTSMQSPNTMANTKANSAWTGPGPSRLRASSPSMSYASLRS